MLRQPHIVALITLCLFSLFGCSGEIDPKNPSPATDKAVRRYLKQIGGNPHAAKTVTYKDLNRDGRNEAIVRIKDPKLCVPEGCPLLVFENTGKKYKFISKTDKVEYLRGITEAKQGWKSLVVTTGKNGEKIFILDFDNGYPAEASLGRSRRGRFNNI